ncbi:MAG: hypothetical protein KGL39_03240 [Patescibacteria group bacterium]|nr:hypothetical protein [Patescibacteria group bacterium]
MAQSLFIKADGAEEAGSAQRAAAQLHGSAYVHAIRYGARGSKEFKRAYSQHIGRFLSCVRAAGRVEKTADEPRDSRGRWATGGAVGLTSGDVKAKVRVMLDRAKRGAVRTRDIIDAAAEHQPGDRRVASYTGAVAGTVASALGGPQDVAELTRHHVAVATGHVINRVLNHPVAQKLISRASRSLRKGLDPADSGELKELVAKMVADLHLPPQIAGSDTALRDVAVGAYTACRDRLLAVQAQSR